MGEFFIDGCINPLNYGAVYCSHGEDAGKDPDCHCCNYRKASGFVSPDIFPGYRCYHIVYLSGSESVNNIHYKDLANAECDCEQEYYEHNNHLPQVIGVREQHGHDRFKTVVFIHSCLLYTSDAADDLLCVDLGGR